MLCRVANDCRSGRLRDFEITIEFEVLIDRLWNSSRRPEMHSYSSKSVDINKIFIACAVSMEVNSVNMIGTKDLGNYSNLHLTRTFSTKKILKINRLSSFLSIPSYLVLLVLYLNM